MRLQLARPRTQLLGPDSYNQFFTMHGSTMMFLFAVPMMFEALCVYLVPLMVGTRNIAFPRLNAYSYYLYLFGGYFPVDDVHPEHRARYGMVLLRAPGRACIHARQARRLLGADDHFHGSLRPVRCRRDSRDRFKLRAPGMSLNRMPMFVWGQAVTAFMVIFAMPAVMLASTML